MRIILSILIIFMLVSCAVKEYYPGNVVGSHKRRLWKEYAAKGDKYAQFELADSYCCNSDHGELDQLAAYFWFCKAALQDHAQAMLEMGKVNERIFVLRGVDTQEDLATSYYWYSKAEDKRISDAANHKQRLINTLPKEVIDLGKSYLENPPEFSCVLPQIKKKYKYLVK